MSASVQDVTVISKHRYQGWTHGYNRSALSNVNTATQLDKMAEGTLICGGHRHEPTRASYGSPMPPGSLPAAIIWQKTVDAAVARMLKTFPTGVPEREPRAMSLFLAAVQHDSR